MKKLWLTFFTDVAKKEVIKKNKNEIFVNSPKFYLRNILTNGIISFYIKQSPKFFLTKIVSRIKIHQSF